MVELSWTIISILVPILIGLGASIMGWSPPEFTLARWCFSISAFIVAARLGWWLAIEQTLITDGVKVALATFVFFGGIGSLWVESLRWVDNRQKTFVSSTDPFHGFLTPANDPSPAPPPTSPPLPKEAVALYLGNSLTYITQPSTTVLRVKGKEIISLKKEGNGALVSAEIFSEDNRIIASLRNNEFDINPNNYFRKEQPDAHTLIVYDQKNRRVLFVRFLNPSAIKILCLLHFSNYPPVEITEEEIRIEGNRFSQGFFANINPALDLE